MTPFERERERQARAREKKRLRELQELDFPLERRSLSSGSELGAWLWACFFVVLALVTAYRECAS